MNENGEMQFPSMESKTWLKNRIVFLQDECLKLEKEINRFRYKNAVLQERVDDYSKDTEMIIRFRSLLDEYSDG